MKTYLFPGQGSQIKGMGDTLFDHYPELTEKADTVLGYSIKTLCLEDPDKQLNQTQYTQPALFVVNALTYLQKMNDTGEKPDFVAGHSLGEYNALFASGAIDFETGLRLVKKRGELMSQATGGAMAAILGLTVQEIEQIVLDNQLTSIDIANYNAPTQIVISGLKEDIDKAEPFFTGDNIYYVPLNTSGAFHSRYMRDSGERFGQYIENFTFSELNIPVISNVQASPYQQQDIQRNLVDQISHPVRWAESMQYLLNRGPMVFEEIGPGDVLSKLIVKIKEESSPVVSKEIPDSVPAESPEKSTSEMNKERQIHNEDFDGKILPSTLGDQDFKKDYGIKYAYLTGGMSHGVASKELLIKIGKAGLMGFLGTGGLNLQMIEDAIIGLKKELGDGQAYGINLLNTPLQNPTVDLLLKHGVRNVEAAAFMQMTPALVKFRLKGLERNPDGSVLIANRVVAKISRPEVATEFLSPAPERIAKGLLDSGVITQEQADLSRLVPMADDLCAEADSGGHTDHGVIGVIVPVMMKLRDEMSQKFGYSKRIRVGAAGGIGSPEAAAAAFVLGADFILTGSINQCTVEAGNSDIVKDLLQDINIQDTEYAPAGDMFELGAKVQVLKRGVLFPSRANKLYELYNHYNSLDEIDEKTKKKLQEKYLKRTFEEVYEDVKAFYPPQEVERAERNPKQKMAFIFRWYFGQASRFALNGVEDRKVDFQVQCGPALGSFNQWVKDTPLQDWRNRHVDEIAEMLMQGTADILNQRFASFR